MIYRKYDIILTPFPFTDMAGRKLRPALIISEEKTFNNKSRHSVMAMITSVQHAAWPLDTIITNLSSAGLPAPSLVRMKLFTLDHRMIVKKIGHLAPDDQTAINNNIAKLLGE